MAINRIQLNFPKTPNSNPKPHINIDPETYNSPGYWRDPDSEPVFESQHEALRPKTQEDLLKLKYKRK